MKNLILLLVLSCFSSCQSDKGIAFTVMNNSESEISDVIFTTSEKLNAITFETLEAKKSVTDFLFMKDNTIDGSYIIEFTRSNGTKESKKIGYYSNGVPLDDWVGITIEDDTVTVKLINSKAHY